MTDPLLALEGLRGLIVLDEVQRFEENPAIPATDAELTPLGALGAASTAKDRRLIPGRLWLTICIGGLTAIALAGAATFGWLRNVQNGPPRVAVLPCDNLSPEPDDAFFAAGLHEEILNRLAQIRGVGVIAGSSVRAYATSRPAIRQIAAELDVEAVMECSVRYADEGVLVAAQLIDSATETHLWSNSYGGDRSDVGKLFELQADIAVNIAKALRAELSPSEERRIWKDRTESPEAYAHILKFIEASRHYAPPLPLYEHLDKAIAADPNFAFAYATRGSLHMSTANSSSVLRVVAPNTDPALLDANRQLELARENAIQALEIDPELGLAHSLLARLMEINGNSADARKSHERAVALSPSDALVLRSYGLFEIGQGRAPQGIELLERARRLDPNLVDSIPYALAGRLDLARDHALAQIDQNPLNPGGHLALATLEATIFDDPVTAEKELRLAEQLARENLLFFHLTTHLVVVYVYGRLGLVEDARRVYDEVLAAMPDEQALTPTARMRAHLAFRETDQAYEWAARMVSDPPLGAARLVFMHNTFDDPAFERPEFVALRRQLGASRL